MGAPNPPGVDVLQGGVLKKSRAQRIDFSGATVTDSGDRATVTVTGGAGGGVNTQNQGVAVDTPATAINFSGNGVAATGGAGTTTVTVKGDRQGLLANRGLASDWPGTVYWATDTQLAYVSDGANWTTMSPLTTTGDLPYWDGTKTNRLAVGNSWQQLGVSGGVPAYNNRTRMLLGKPQGTQVNFGTSSPQSILGGPQDGLIALNELAVGDMIYIKAAFRMDNGSAGASTMQGTLTWRYNAGAITGAIATTFPLSVAAASTNRMVIHEIVLVVRSLTAGTVVVFDGQAWSNIGGAAGATLIVVANTTAQYLTGVGSGNSGNNGPYGVDYTVSSSAAASASITAQLESFAMMKVSL